MTTIGDITSYLGRLAPLDAAEEWDNVGLLIGDAEAAARTVLTCLTVTESVVTEAIESSSDLIITHHPLPFRPLARITADALPGRHVWRLARAGVSLYSAHTAYDSAESGINAQIAQRLQLVDVAPLRPFELHDAASHSSPGAGRIGTLSDSIPLRTLADRVKRSFELDHVRVAGPLDRMVARVAIGCGSGGSFLEDAVQCGADVLLTGETTLHTILHGLDAGLCLLLTGHYASERFAMEHLAEQLAAEFPELSVRAAQAEQPPWRLW